MQKKIGGRGDWDGEGVGGGLIYHGNTSDWKGLCPVFNNTEILHKHSFSSAFNNSLCHAKRPINSNSWILN